jgi:hypothetical protein
MTHSQDRVRRPSLSASLCACVLAAAALSACGGGNGSEDRAVPEASPQSAADAMPMEAALPATAEAVEAAPLASEQTSSESSAATEARATALSISAQSTSDSIQPKGIAAGTGTASATLYWGAPKTLANGAYTNSLAGFRVYYGTTPGSYAGTAYFAGGTLSHATVSGLGHGTWYFVVSAVDAAGSESSASYQLSKKL